MVRFKNLRATNAGSFGELSVCLEKQGMVLVVGENRDEPRTPDGKYHSNGSGKSTIFELLTHGLYQTTSKGNSKNSLVNLYNPKDFLIEVEFSRDGHDYLVRQTRKHKQYGTALYLYEDDRNISLTGTKAMIKTQNLIEQKVGLNLGEWFGFVYLAQNYTHAMVSGTPSEKRAYLSRVFNIDAIDDYDEKLRVYCTDLSGKIEKLNVLLEQSDRVSKQLEQGRSKTYSETIDEDLSRIRSKVGKYESLVAASRNLKSRRKIRKKLVKYEFDISLLTNLDKVEKAIKGLQQELRDSVKAEEVRQRKSDLKSKLTNDVPNEKSIQKEIHRLDHDIESLTDECKIATKLAKVEEELSKLEVKGGKEDLESSIEKQETYNKRVSSCKEALAVLKSELKSLKGLDSVSKCPTCLRPVDSEHVTKMAKGRESEIQGHEKNLEKTKTKLEKLEVAIEGLEVANSLNNEAVSLKDKITSKKPREKLEAAKSRHEKLSKQLLTAREVTVIQRELDSLPDLGKPLDDETKHRKQRLLDLLQQAKAHDWNIQDVDIATVKAKRDSARSRVEELLQLRTERDHNVKVQKQLKSELDGLKSKIEKLEVDEQKSSISHTMRLALKDLKSIRLHEATKILTSILPAYVSALFPSKHVKVHIDDSDKDSFELIFEKGGKSVPLTALSGGQGKKLSIAIILAFTRLSSKSTNILIADEPYGSLDRPSRQICDELLRDVGVESTFLTTHDTDLLARRYDQVWRCVMRDEISTLKI